MHPHPRPITAYVDGRVHLRTFFWVPLHPKSYTACHQLNHGRINQSTRGGFHSFSYIKSLIHAFPSRFVALSSGLELVTIRFGYSGYSIPKLQPTQLLHVKSESPLPRSFIKPTPYHIPLLYHIPAHRLIHCLDQSPLLQHPCALILPTRPSETADNFYFFA